jgi:archaellum biogenesis protein FlaJ (TadC family)
MKKYRLIYREIWLFLGLFSVIVIIFELLWPQSVQSYLNPVIVLIFWLIFGILYLYSLPEKD